MRNFWGVARVAALTRRLQHSSGNKKAEDDADKEAEAGLQEIKNAGGKKGDEVVDKLIQAVVDVRPEASEKIVGKS